MCIRDRVNNVVSPQSLLMEALKLAIKISNNSPIAVKSAIRAMNAGYDKNQNGFDVEMNEFGKCFGTNDFKEGVGKCKGSVCNDTFFLCLRRRAASNKYNEQSG